VLGADQARPDLPGDGAVDEAVRFADSAVLVQRRTGHQAGEAAAVLVRARAADADLAAARADCAEAGVPAPVGPPDAWIAG
jgi:hypothetical protein